MQNKIRMKSQFDEIALFSARVQNWTERSEGSYELKSIESKKSKGGIRTQHKTMQNKIRMKSQFDEIALFSARVQNWTI